MQKPLRRSATCLIPKAENPNFDAPKRPYPYAIFSQATHVQLP